MKKLCILMALILALACVPALAAEGDAVLGRDEGNVIYFDRGFTDGDTLYLSNYDNLYTWRLGEPALTEYSYNKPGMEANGDCAVLPFLSDGQLYAVTLITRYDEHTNFEGAKLNALTLNDDNTVGFEELRELDWDNLVEYYDQDSYPTQPDTLMAADGKLYMRHYNSQYDNVVSAVDLDTGRLEQVDALNDTYALTPYRDDQLLVEQYSYQQSDKARLLVYDPRSDSAQLLAELQIDEYSPLTGLAYDSGTDTIYCVKGGEICPVNLEDGTVGVGVTSMPAEGYGGASAGMVMNGGYLVYCADGAYVRNLDPGQRAEIRLKISDSAYATAINQAYGRFTNTHGNVDVVLSRDYNEVEKLVENMMNRDDSVDIYTLYTSSAIFDALFNRGYLMELDSETINALAERMYPSLRECLSQNGKLVALPLELNCWTMGVNEKALELLGMGIEDVPDNWSDFLDFLKKLEGPLSEAKNVSLTYEGYTVGDMRNELFYNIFDCYQRYVNTVDPNMGYNTPLLHGLLDKLDGIDFTALGCAEDEEDEDAGYGRGISYSTDLNVLIQTGTGCTFGNFQSEYTPIWMGLDADTPVPMVADTAVAFVNPFTRHPQEALEFMDQVADSLPNATLYDLDPSLNEPIKGTMYEESLEEIEANLNDLRSQLENAEPADAQMLEESVANAEEYLQFLENYGWEIGQRDIDWYRPHAENIVIAPVNWLYADESGEAWELMSQYRQGNISADEMLRGIDRKVQMMQMEGN